MTARVLEDYKNKPFLFFWNDPIEKEWLWDWLAKHELSLPSDLVDIWLLTGGGDMFETETLLSPTGDPFLGDNIEDVNSQYHQNGLDSNYWIIHLGVVLTALRPPDNTYVVLDRKTFHLVREYVSFDDWYVHELRQEYTERYGLS